MTLLQLFFMFSKICMFTIGGGYALLPLIQQALVSNNLMTLSESLDMIGISQMTPGPLAVNAATYVGMKLGLDGGGFGYALFSAAVTTVGAIFPSIIITIIVARFFFSFNKKEGVKSVMTTLRVVVIGLIFSAACSVALIALYPNKTFDIPVVVLTIVFIGLLMFVKKLSPVMLILSAGIIGAVFLR